ncbi:glycosyltransferase family 1 protein [Thermoflexus sp.]|uniref:glycosyltransferase family 4 protein n=1 Tax=Thermoflexus sp. TaxID=1969742 RepID=UPI0025E756C2|nr:glycosyltransferase family 1 protein [Thermoflexus sp.]MCS7350332.1 glycosyltransferase family 4 protein [Thermoflexus sp.]MCX7689823.1 glycosyltransferase family 4 protein [Thermoflexus sp.]MDW8179783.1 glycosyltransferase family 1 protein [Anaerolineae bacterium]
MAWKRILGIDASRTTLAHPTGVERYAQAVIRALIPLAEAEGVRLRLYFRDPPPHGLFPDSPWVEHRVLSLPRLWTHLRLSWEMARHPPTALFVPAHVIPLYHPPSAVTIHDLGYRYFPQTHPLLQRLYLDLSTRWSAAVARVVFADSQATRADLIRFYRVRPEKIAVAYPGYDPPPVPTDPESILHRFRIQRPYIISVGTIHPRKNFSLILQVIARRIAKGWEGQVVIVGKPGWPDPAFERLSRDPIWAGRLIRTGYADDESRGALLSQAEAFLFPSLYEGFGFPVLEAQACGVPVLCAPNGSLREVAGEGALLLPPDDPDPWVEALDRLACDPGFRAALIARGHANRKRFSWEACARTIWESLRELLRL